MTNNNYLDDYYQNCPFPKPPKEKKKKLLENGWKDKPNRRCWYTGKPGAERHEVFPGISRQISIELGFQVDVSPEYHRRLHANADHWAQVENQKWRMFYQHKWEEEQIGAGTDPDEARERWILMMGRNYL